MDVECNSERIMNYFTKFVDETGIWILKTNLKESDKREIHHIIEQLENDINSLEQLLQEEIKTKNSNSKSSNKILIIAISSYVSIFFNSYSFLYFYTFILYIFYFYIKYY